MDQRTFDIKVKELAEKLKSTGVVTSDAMAKNMAADIVKTEQATRKKYEQPQQEQKQQESSSQPSETPKNMVVEEAIKNAQGAAHQARVEDGIDQTKSISELLDEDPKPNQPKVTLDNPVVENGVAREEKETSPQEFSVPQTPKEARGSGAPTPAVEPEKPQMPSPEPASVPNPTPQPEPTTQAQPEQQAPQKQAEPEQKKESEPVKKDQPDVDLSEMFNFSKK